MCPRSYIPFTLPILPCCTLSTTTLPTLTWVADHQLPPSLPQLPPVAWTACPHYQLLCGFIVPILHLDKPVGVARLFGRTDPPTPTLPHTFLPHTHTFPSQFPHIHCSSHTPPAPHLPTHTATHLPHTTLPLPWHTTPCPACCTCWTPCPPCPTARLPTAPLPTPRYHLWGPVPTPTRTHTPHPTIPATCPTGRRSYPGPTFPHLPHRRSCATPMAQFNNLQCLLFM